ncbi:unnamed protein product [Allacma fusca]|uniref:Serum response factor-binding protein 1 n=1 Tax=Allacma fusca TaxID=39272 RepID=A0A8J2P4A2_9HEXA|nr:unnamed protein product [Allacma fusca]
MNESPRAEMETKKPEPGPGLTKKQELNNHIVLMRKSIRQAKVHIIRKLSREVKKLRERRGAEEVQQKSNRKADRLVKDIVSIKGFEEDKVSISALRTTLELDAVLQNPNSTAEDRALVRLASHPSVNAQVTKYRDANPHWRLQIPVLLEKTPQKLKIAEKKAVEKQNRKKVQKPKPVLKEESLALESTDNITDGDEEIDSNSENKITKVEVELPKESKGTVTRAKVAPKKPAVKSEPKKEPKAVDINKLNKLQGTVKVQVIKDWSEFETSSPVVSSFTPEVPAKKPRSSFFLGGEDEPEDLTKIEVNDSKPNVPFERRGGRNSNNKFQKPGKNSWGSADDNHNLKWKMPKESVTDSVPDFDNKRKPARKERKESKNFKAAETKPEAPVSSEKLHPSWEAKKRQSIAITAFQGKKITFDD